MQSCLPGPGLPPVKAGLLSAAVMFQPVIVGPLAGLGQISRSFSQAIEPPPARYLTSVSKTHDRSAAVSACLCSSEGTLSSKRVCKCACVRVRACVSERGSVTVGTECAKNKKGTLVMWRVARRQTPRPSETAHAHVSNATKVAFAFLRITSLFVFPC